jgi:hypothetical protein
LILSLAGLAVKSLADGVIASARAAREIRKTERYLRKK